jgi:hypothetical protein
MCSHELDMAEVCLRMAEEATGEQRRRLLDLAGKWLAKAPADLAKSRVASVIAAMRRPM